MLTFHDYWHILAYPLPPPLTDNVDVIVAGCKEDVK